MVPQTLRMKKLMLTALLCLCAAWLAFTRNSPPPAASSRQRVAVLSDTTAPILTTIVTAAVPAHPNPAVPPRPVTLRVFIRDSSLSLSGLVLEWELQVNGVTRQKGAVSNLVIGPQHTTLVHLPVRPPVADSDEAFLQVQYRYRKATPAAGIRRPATPATNTRQPGSPATSTRQPIAAATPMGPVIAEAQLLLKAPAGNDLVIRPAGELSFTDTNDIFTIQSPAIHLEFNKQTGWLQRYTVKGVVLLDDTAGLRSVFWLPGGGDAPSRSRPAAGDTTSRPAAGDTTEPWLEATRDPRLQLFSTSTGSEMVIVRAEYTLPATSCLMHLSYTVNASGEIGIEQSLESDSTQKGWPLPCFGMQWALPAGFDSIAYYGLGVRQPDSVRAAAKRIGIYRQLLSAPPSPDTHSREMTTATAVRWWKITGPGHSGLLITADSSQFNGSALYASSIRLNIYYRQPAGSAFDDAPGLSFHLPYGNYRYGYKITPVTAVHP
jgi:beta-galactosidase